MAGSQQPASVAGLFIDHTCLPSLLMFEDILSTLLLGMANLHTLLPSGETLWSHFTFIHTLGYTLGSNLVVLNL